MILFNSSISQFSFGMDDLPIGKSRLTKSPLLVCEDQYVILFVVVLFFINLAALLLVQ